MPVRYTFTGPIFRLDCFGESTILEIMRAFDEALAHPRFPERARLLMDVRRSTSLAHQSYTEILWISGVVGGRAHRFGGKCAVLAPSAMADVLTRAGAVFAPDFGAEGRIFSDEAEACAWLGVEPAPACAAAVAV